MKIVVVNYWSKKLGQDVIVCWPQSTAQPSLLQGQGDESTGKFIKYSTCEPTCWRERKGPSPIIRSRARGHDLFPLSLNSNVVRIYIHSNWVARSFFEYFDVRIVICTMSFRTELRSLSGRIATFGGPEWRLRIVMKATQFWSGSWRRPTSTSGRGTSNWRKLF